MAERVVFSASIEGWQLIGLDAHLPGQIKGEPSNGTLTWLAEELDRTSNCPTVLILHHPSHLSTEVPSAWSDAIGLADWDDLWSVLRSHH